VSQSARALCQSATVGARFDLQPLQLGGMPFHMPNRPALRGGLQGVGHEVERGPDAGSIVEQDEQVGQVAGQAVSGVRDDVLDLAGADAVAHRVELRAVGLTDSIAMCRPGLDCGTYCRTLSGRAERLVSKDVQTLNVEQNGRGRWVEHRYVCALRPGGLQIYRAR
jgi:hypothetical protein